MAAVKTTGLEESLSLSQSCLSICRIAILIFSLQLHAAGV
jgi:hypothetical protein